jgi:other hect domain ubiquitin protein ligase E3
MNLNRMKAMKFYEKNIVDYLGESTIFGQLYHKMKKYPVNNYLCTKGGRLFVVKLSGEGATDYGGPYREVFSSFCDELHSKYLDLFIKSPNNKNEVGALRDKFVPNPNAKSAIQIDMFYFLGCLLGSAISSGQLLNLNIHPIIWQLILNQTIDFSEYETIDRHFYKLILDLEKTTIIDNQEFEAVFDLFFTIQLSDGSEYDLISDGKQKRVTLENKERFISLSKTVKLNEFKVQVESIRYGLM